jgi:hypothetical protein
MVSCFKGRLWILVVVIALGCTDLCRASLLSNLWSALKEGILPADSQQPLQSAHQGVDSARDAGAELHATNSENHSTNHTLHSHMNSTAPGQQKPLIFSTVTRFSNISALSKTKVRAKKSHEPLVLLSITSGAHHSHLRHSIRSTWLLPCIASPLCQYRFFVDASASAGNVSTALLEENDLYADMVFRDYCPYMQQRHPAYIHYGNSQVSSFGKESLPGVQEDPVQHDYRLRRMYKIDWKICFFKFWQRESTALGISAGYPDHHVLIEDDSFTCTENLLYQFALLRRRREQQQSPLPLYLNF